ncbi:MAG TPA: carboxypeptidase regulatory-like domain-containing protein [Aridibacter sp.]|nr:carboxypeptidase regulatory-like domain-containing protein [Aridibacter sp.]
MNPARRPFAIRVLIGFSFVFILLVSVQSAAAASTIQGNVYDRQRNPLPDIEVELLNDLYQSRGRTRTDGLGKYQFTGLGDGWYTIRVYAFRYDLEDQSAQLEVNTLNIRGQEGTGFFMQDFYLVPRTGGLADNELGVVFAQEIPDEARKLYDKAIRDLSGERNEAGVLGLYEAIKIFPDYYLALHRIGRELFVVKNYEQAVPYLIRAIEVNGKSATSLYYLGYSLNELGPEFRKAAVKTLHQAYLLAPGSVQVLYIYGRVLRAEKQFAEAEKHLLQAKKLSRTPIPEIHKELAQLYGNDLKNYKQAADELELYLKASNVGGEESKEVKKTILDLRAKAKSQPSQS